MPSHSCKEPSVATKLLALGRYFSSRVASPPAGAEVGWYREDFEACFAKSASGAAGHVHRGGHQKDPPDAARSECLVAPDGVLVRVDGFVLFLNDSRRDVPFLEQPGHPGGLGSLAGLVAYGIVSAAAEYQRRLPGAI